MIVLCGVLVAIIIIAIVIILDLFKQLQEADSELIKMRRKLDSKEFEVETLKMYRSVKND